MPTNRGRRVGKNWGSSLYSTADYLRVFGQTLSYWNYYHRKLPLLLHEIAPTTGGAKRSRLSVLDMGCGGGDLSIPVFNTLAASFPRLELTAVDPSEANLRDFRLAYQNQRPKFSLKKAQCNRFQDFRAREEFDLVLCSHSLYEVFEKTEVGVQFKSRILGSLMNLVKPTGGLCIMFASRNSWAYHFKREAYGLLGFHNRFFMTAEDFHEMIPSGRVSCRETIVDTYIDADIFWSGRTKEKEQCLKWLSYFLRVDCFDLSGQTQRKLIDLMKRFSLPFASLPEKVRRDFKKYPAACRMPSDRTQVVFHKENVFLLRKLGC